MTIQDQAPAAVPESSDHSSDAGDEAALFDALMSSSTLINGEGEALPDNSDDGNLDDSSDDDLEDEDDSTDDEDDGDDEGTVPKESTDDDEDDSTGDDDEDDGAADEGEIDWEFEIDIKVDGDESKVTLEELRKGYQTQQHLSKQGRELGDAKVAFDAEKAEKMEQLVSTADVLTAQVKLQETDLSTQYAEKEAEYKAFKKDGDKYAASEAKDELEGIQGEYWKAVRSREALEANIAAAREQEAEATFKEQLEHFETEIEEFIPGFDKDRAALVRDFAISEGVPDELLGLISSAAAVKFIDDYRLLKEGAVKGKAKRKATPARKVTPTRKAKSPAMKKKANSNALSKKLSAGEASEAEGFDLLRGLASKYV